MRNTEVKGFSQRESLSSVFPIRKIIKQKKVWKEIKKYITIKETNLKSIVTGGF